MLFGSVGMRCGLGRFAGAAVPGTSEEEPVLAWSIIVHGVLSVAEGGAIVVLPVFPSSHIDALDLAIAPSAIFGGSICRLGFPVFLENWSRGPFFPVATLQGSRC